jgi:5'-deoxynucleotidase YfbR-like HD superfamily hydrolase
MNITRQFIFDVFTQFADSDYGKKLAAQIRYSPFKPAKVTADEWCQLLGDDVNNLRHMSFTLELAEELLEHDTDLSEKEKLQLYLACVIHDWGEAIVGDINYAVKTDSDEEREKKAFAEILNSIIEEDDIKELLKKVYVDVAMEPNTKLGKVFNAIEKIGYVSTAIKAMQLLDNRNDIDDQLKVSLVDLATKVFFHQIQALVKYAKDYKWVDNYLRHYEREIQSIADKEMCLKYPQQINAWRLYYK